MGVHKYISCEPCQGIGVIPIRPRSEWTNDIEANFEVCVSCHGLGRVRAAGEVESLPDERADGAAGS
jgi:hypothetical protein